MAKKKDCILSITVVIIVAAAFVSGMKYGPVLVEALRGGVEEPKEPTGEFPSAPDGAEYWRLEEIVRQAAEKHRAEPVNAVFNSNHNIVIPGLNGYEIDQEATLTRLAAAEPGRPVAPVWRVLTPAVTADDYPTAIIDRGHPTRGQVTLMINVAWGNEYLPQMLDVLDQYSVKTTFFPVGRWVERFPGLLEEIDRRGHECGNHGYSDWEVFADLDYPAAVDSLRRANEAVARITGHTPRWFTPHKGEYNKSTREAAADLRMRLLLWTLDTVDWQRPGEEVMARRILDNLVPGAIILMHPTEQSAGFLRLLLPEIESRGYRVVTMSELLSPEPLFPEVFLEK